MLQLRFALCFALSLRAAKQSVIQAPSPLTRKKILSSVVSNLKIKFSILKARVSVHQICKFERKESRHRIFSSDEAVANEAKERICNT